MLCFLACRFCFFWRAVLNPGFQMTWIQKARSLRLPLHAPHLKRDLVSPAWFCQLAGVPLLRVQDHTESLPEGCAGQAGTLWRHIDSFSCVGCSSVTVHTTSLLTRCRALSSKWS